MRIRSRARTIMEWRPRNLEESLIPLMTLQGLIGHGVFHCTLCKSTFFISIIYSTTIALVFLVSVYLAVSRAWNADWFRPEDQTIIYVIFANTAIWTFAGINSWYNRKRYIQTVRKVSIIDESLGQLGEPCDYNAIFRFGIRMIVFCLFGIIAATVIDILWVDKRLSVGEIILFSAVFHYPIHVNTIFIINVASSIGLVRSRLAKINNILETIASKPSYPKEDFWQLSWGKNFESFHRISVLSTRNSFEIDKRLVQIIKHMHLELCDVPKEIERSYGIQIALEMAANFVTLSGLLHDIYWLFVNQLQPQRAIHITMRSFWFTIHFMKLLFINSSCARMISEARRTGDIIHVFSVPNDEVIFKDDIRQFAMQMILNPVSISPAGMFTLDNRFVTKFLASMITYVVIVIQMCATPFIRNKNKHS